MTVHYDAHGVTLHHGDSLDILATLPDASVDAVVTDPPYGLEFMGKEWDKFGDVVVDPASVGGFQDGNGGNPYSRSRIRYGIGNGFQSWCTQWATEALRVLKPGGHLLAFGGTRTWHRIACAIEDAGFEIRDSIAWMYGSGFPKSLDVSKAIDRAAGATREVVGTRGATDRGAFSGPPDSSGSHIWSGLLTSDAPATPDAARWAGWGTALKPAHEPIVVARKPLAGTVAANILAHGTGALNVDGCRIGDEVRINQPMGAPQNSYRGYGAMTASAPARTATAGRWPANVVLDESQAAALDAQSGESVSPVGPVRQGGVAGYDPRENAGTAPRSGFGVGYADSGGASRFLYVAKADADERPTYHRPTCECEDAWPTRHSQGLPAQQ